MMALFTVGLIMLLCNVATCTWDCGGNYEYFEESVLPLIKSHGYTVTEGSFSWLSNQSAYAANPSLYYTLFGLPRLHSIPDITSSYEVVNAKDDGFASVIDDGLGTRGHMTLNKTYFIHGSTAIVWYGCLPPSKYFSFKMYQNRRYNPPHPMANDSQQNNEHYPVSHPYSSLGDMLNHEVLHRTSSGLTMIVFTPDNQTYSDIVNAVIPHLKALNLTNSNQINLDPMPYRNIPIDGPGYGEGESCKTIDIYYLKYSGFGGALKQIFSGEPLDSFNIMGRSGLPLNDAAFDQYLKTKQKIFRIDYNGDRAVPFHSLNVDGLDKPRVSLQPLLRNVSTGIYERDSLQPYFTEYVHSIYQHFAVNGATRYNLRYVSTHISRPGYVGNNLFGFNCLKYGTRCMADNRDSQYYVTWPDVQILSNSSIHIVVGVQHTATGKAQWESIVPMFQDKGFHHKFYRSHYLHLTPDNYNTSAVAFPPGIDDAIPKDVLDKFFVIASMRPVMCRQYFDDKQFPELHAIPKFCFDENDFGYNESGKFFFVHRNYVNPKTKTRPAAEEMLPLMVMQFDSQWFDFNAA